MYQCLKLENQLCFRLYAVSRLITQAYHPFLEPLGLTYPQYLVMLVLWENDNQTVNDIAHKLLLETNTLTPLLKRMEKEGLVVRSKSVVDGRQVLVSLTKQGRHLEEKAKDVPASMTDAWNVSDFDGDHFRHLASSLDSLIAILKKD